MHALIRSTAAVTALGLIASTMAFHPSALGEDHMSDAEHCISLNRIDRTEILDDQHILFEMRDDTTYLNTLANRCPGLEIEQTFMYRTAISQLCDLDIITVLRNDFQFGMAPGPSCGLGMFEPVTPEEVEALKARADAHN